MSVQRNLNYGHRPARSSEIDANLIVDILGLEKLLDRRPDTLSGGENSGLRLLVLYYQTLICCCLMNHWPV